MIKSKRMRWVESILRMAVRTAYKILVRKRGEIRSLEVETCMGR
jgi:hypothetical protein